MTQLADPKFSVSFGSFKVRPGIFKYQKAQLLGDPLFNRTFMGMTENELPEETRYLTCELGGVFLGAVLYVPEGGGYIELHPALNVELKKHVPLIMELVVLHLRIQGYPMYAVVPDHLPAVQNYAEKRHGLIPEQIKSTALFGDKESTSKVYVIPRELNIQYAKEVTITWE